MKNILRTYCLLLAALLLWACDEHEPVDLDIHPGYILCSDGRIINDAEYEAGKHTPVAVVFAEQTDHHPVLAVSISEISSVSFADTLGVKQNTSCSLTAYDGYTNTVALQKAESMLGQAAFGSHYFAQSDFVPSVQELGLLYIALSRVNPVIEKCGGTPVSTGSDGPGCWYWSSTEVSENQSNQAWLFSMADGSIHRTPKTNHYRARLVVEYNPLSINR